jgi:hypothetical protein
MSSRAVYREFQPAHPKARDMTKNGGDTEHGVYEGVMTTVWRDLAVVFVDHPGGMELEVTT